jgi:hypothetical protein
MTKPIGATQKQLEENNIEWVYRPDYTHSSEYDWAKERTMLLQEIANLRRQVARFEDALAVYKV